MWEVMKIGWVFVLPIAILMYFLFWLGYPPGVAALYSAASLVVLMIIRDRRPPSLEHWKSFLFGSGEILVPLLLIAGAAGIILGVMNSTGLAFQLSIILAHLGETYGVFVMLLLTSLIRRRRHGVRHARWPRRARLSMSLRPVHGSAAASAGGTTASWVLPSFDSSVSAEQASVRSSDSVVRLEAIEGRVCPVSSMRWHPRVRLQKSVIRSAGHLS